MNAGNRPVAVALGLAFEKIDYSKPLNPSGVVHVRASNFIPPCIPPLPDQA